MHISFQNKFNASNLSTYLSPFSGLDVSNNQNPSTNKNVSILFWFFIFYHLYIILNFIKSISYIIYGSDKKDLKTAAKYY